jgi:hypothetical protein
MWQDPEEAPDRLESRPLGPGKLVISAVGLATAIVLALFLVGQPQVSVNSSPHHPAPVPGPQTATRIPPPPVRFDPMARTFLTDGLAGKLPSGWFTHQYGYINIGTGIGGCFGNGCRQNVSGQHPIEDNIPWGAEFEVVQLEESLTGADLGRTADRILTYWAQYSIFYADATEGVRVTNTSSRTVSTGLPRPARMITADLHYRRPGTTIIHDHFYLLVVGGMSGRYTAFIAVWSDNATDDTKNAIQDSINTLRVV